MLHVTHARIVTLLLFSGLAACGQSASEDPPPASGATPEAPQDPPEGTPSAAMRDVESTPALVAAGRTSFQPCAACHGEDARGRTGQGPALNSPSFLAAASDDFLRRTILHGRAGTTMPPWPSLEGEAVSGIIAYLRSLAETEPAELNEGPLNGDVEAGGQVFASICAGCHGRTGAGYQETSNGTGIGRRAFLSDVSNGFLRYIIENGKTETQMHGFAADEPIAVANLTHDEIENVIAYLRANAW